MSIRSMTGYGGAACELGGRRYELSLRSVNHRFLDLKLFLPRFCEPLEGEIARLLKERLARGHVSLAIRPFGAEAEGPAAVHLDLATARTVYEALLKLQETFSLPDAPTLALLANFREIFSFVEPTLETEELKEELWKAIGEALDSLEAMREAEGAALAEDILSRVENARALSQQIETRSPEAVEARHRRMTARLGTLLEELSLTEVDPEVLKTRIALEIALLAEKTDVSEEVTRLRSHLDQLEVMVRQGGPQGRRLDFLVQELNREANTIGSKCQDAELARLIVELKAEIEKLREQVQNVE